MEAGLYEYIPPSDVGLRTRFSLPWRKMVVAVDEPVETGVKVSPPFSLELVLVRIWDGKFSNWKRVWLPTRYMRKIR